MKIIVDFSKELSGEDVAEVLNADWDRPSPALIEKALIFIADAIQEGKLGLERYGCNGEKKALERIISGKDPVAQEEILSDLAYAFEKAHGLAIENGGVDLDLIPVWRWEFGDYTLGDVLRHGIAPLIKRDERKCGEIRKLLKELNAFAEEFATLNAPYFPYVETDTINVKRLKRAVGTARRLIEITGGTGL